MFSLIEVLEKIAEDKRWIPKVLIGGLLMFIPVVNFFALGYLSRYAGRMMESGKVELPEWDEWGRLFMGGLIFLVVILVYGVLTLLVGWVLSSILEALTMGVLGWLPYIPLSFAAVMAPSLTLMGLFTIRKGDGLDALYLKIGKHMRVMCEHWKELLLVNITFIGLIVVGMPLYGFTFFVGFLLLIPYTVFVLSKSE